MPPPQQNATIAIAQPIHGVVRSVSREEGAEQSLISSLNVVPYGAFDGFRRLSQRAGSSTFGSTVSGDNVQGMLGIGYIIQAGGFITAPPTVPFSTFNNFPFPLVGPTAIISTSGGGFGWIAYNKSSVTIQFTVAWTVSTNGANNPGIVGAEFELGLTSTANPAVPNSHVLVIGFGTYIQSSTQQSVGGTAGAFSLQADPGNVFFFPAASTVNGGSFTFTGTYTISSADTHGNIIFATESISGTTTASSTAYISTTPAKSGSLIFNISTDNASASFAQMTLS